MKLSKLLSDFVSPDLLSELPSLAITGLALDSRQIRKGDVFLAYPGYQTDGRNFIAQAIEKGAIAILCEQDEKYVDYSTENHIPIIPIADLRKKISHLVGRFYQHPSKQMLIIGITGTNGKSSCVKLISDALTQLGKKTGMIGTLGYGMENRFSPAPNTTPDALTLQTLLHTLSRQQAKAVAMEVSSHALTQGRVEDIDIDMAIFTNLTRDHLDYHKNMQAYAEAKQKLFDMSSLKYAVLNADDPFGLHLLNTLPSHLKIVGYSLDPKITQKTTQHIILAENINLSIAGIHADLKTPWGKGKLTSKLLGRFNLSNLLAVIAALGLLEYSLDKILKIISALSPVHGRMQLMGGHEKPWVIIDFAHTPDALEQALKALKPLTSKSLWCVFGCGGTRDRGKRPIMGNIAERYADHIILTNDNPRFESPEAIIDEIAAGITHKNKIKIYLDRKQAIEYALSHSKSGDTILIAGKGHENYQVIGHEKIEFDDTKVVETLLNHTPHHQTT